MLYFTSKLLRPNTSRMTTFLSRVETAKPYCYYLSIHAKPGARSSGIAQRPKPGDEALEVRIGAPPVEGQANEELVNFMGDLLEAQWKALVAAEETETKTQKSKNRSVFLETYLKDTSYAELLQQKEKEKKAQAEAAQEDNSGNKAKKGKKKSSKGGNQPEKDSGKSNKPPAEMEVLRKVTVRLSKGTTSKYKTLLVEIPEEEEVVVSLLEMASEE